MDATVARRVLPAYYRIVTILVLLFTCLLPTGIIGAPAEQHQWEQLLIQLGEANPVVRRSAAYQLGQLSLSDNNITTALIDATTDVDSSVRSVAAAALGKRGITTLPVVDALTALLDDAEPTVRYAAASAFGHLSGPAAFSAISTLLKTVKIDRHGDVRYAAAAAISHIGLPNDDAGLVPTADVDVLLAALADPHWYSRQAIAAALATAPRATAHNAVTLLNDIDTNWAIRSQIVQLAPMIGTQWTADFVPMVSEVSPAVQESGRLFGSITLLRSLPQPLLLSLYQTLATGEERQLQIEASGVLGYLGEPAIPYLLPLLGNSRVGVAPAAMDALHVIGPPAIAQAVDYFGEALAHGSLVDQSQARAILRKFGQNALAVAPFVNERLAAATDAAEVIDLIETLASITPAQPATLPTLLAIAQSPDRSVEERVAAISAIGNYGAEASAAIDPLLTLLTTQQRPLYQALLSVLASIGNGSPQVVDALAAVSTEAQWDESERSAALGQLATMKMAAASVVPLLEAQLANTQSITIRVAAVETLGAIGPQAAPALPLLRPLVISADESLLADAAATALATIGEPATPTLISLLRPEWPPAVQARARSALAVQATAALPALNFALVVEPVSVQLQIVQILEEIGPRSIQTILIALHNSDPTVRERAIEVLHRGFAKYDEQNSTDGLQITKGFAVDEAIPLLIAALQTSDVERQQQAAASLGFIGPPAAVAAPLLGIALTSEDQAVRCTAVLALIYIGPDAAAASPYLAKALHASAVSEDCELHDMGPRLVLSRRPHEAASERVIALSRLNGERVDRQILLMEALTILGAPAPTAVPALIDRLHDETQRRYAAEALRTVGVGAAPALAQLFTQSSAALSLATSEVVPELEDALAGMGNDLRRSAIYALPLIEPLPTSVRTVLEALAEDPAEDPALRTMTVTVLADQERADLARRQGSPLQPPFLPPLADPTICPYWPAMNIQQPLRFDRYWERCLYVLPNSDAPTIDQVYQAIVRWLGG